jgi:outer membrane lipoprotein-sorting protein
MVLGHKTVISFLNTANKDENHMKKMLSFLFLILMLHLLPSIAAAESREEKGLAIAREAERRNESFQDFTADMRMVLRNRHGQESIRTIRIRTLEVEGDGDKSLSIFDDPRDVKGTAFLTYSHKAGDDDQWLYLPAMKRVKRISSRNKSGSFMGSEFSYEDIASQEIEKYTYKWLRDELYDGRQCFVSERYPVDRKNSGYTRQLIWLDKAEYRPFKIEYFDRKNALLKTLTVKNYQQYQNKFWRAGEMHVVNHQSGKSTALYWTNYQFRTGLTDDAFSKNSLKRAK